MLADRRGVVLIITLWVLTLLSVLALSFSSSARRENTSARNFSEDLKTYYLAVSAYEEALHWLATDPDPDVDFIDEDGVFRTDPERDPISGVRESDEAIVELTVLDEEARINLNRLNTSTLSALLVRSGVSEDMVPELTDAFMDWTDKDDLHHLHGAEDAYYDEFGYMPKNGPLDTLDELLLVKGYDEELLFGNGEGTGIAPLVTTWGQMVNVNTAPAEVLEILGVDTLHVDAIIEGRTDRGLRRLPRALDKIGSTNSAFYRIEVRSRLRQSPVTVTITAIVMRTDDEGNEKLVTVYWKESRESSGS